MAMMIWAVWGGAALSVLGLAGLVWSIVIVSRARRRGLSEDEMRGEIRRAMPLNLGALFLSVLGLMIVILGVFLS
ncbi:MAG: hypothetical protein ACLFRU_11455 [Paracoccaceae bacterium]